MTTGSPRKPVAVTLGDPKVMVVARDEEPTLALGRTVLVEEPEAPAEAAEVPRAAPRRGLGLGALFFAALGGLASLAVGVALDGLVRDLFQRADWLGWVGLGLTALALLAGVALVGREWLGLARLRRIDDLRLRAADAFARDDDRLAEAVADDTVRLYAARPETARARAALAEHRRGVLDGRDLVALTERELLGPLDAEARRLVMDSAKRVSLVTAVSPRALYDVLFVAVESQRLIGRVAALYGGRPGGLGFLRLGRAVLGHLTLTGGIAIGDSLVQQLVGHGLAARLSAKLGEGVVNGMMTARVGLAVIDLTRPLPFLKAERPAITDLFAELTRVSGGEEATRP